METWGCNKKIKCPVKWTQNKGGNKYANWANWSHCKGNCGNGSRDRWRRCDAGWNKCQSQGPPKVKLAIAHIFKLKVFWSFLILRFYLFLLTSKG